MKNNSISKIIVLISMLWLMSCSGNDHRIQQQHGLVDNSGSLIADSGKIIADIQTITPESGKKIINVTIEGTVNYDTRNQQTVASRVQGRIEKLYVKYNYQKVKRGQKIMDIYSSDLSSAQRELLMLTSSGETARISAAEKKLSLLGMSAGSILQVKTTGKILYSVPIYSEIDGYVVESNNNEAANGSALLAKEGQYLNAGESVFDLYTNDRLIAEFYVPPAIQAFVKKDQRLLYYPMENKQDMRSGRVGLVEPVYRDGESFALARIYTDASKLIKGELLQAIVPVSSNNGWWLPRSAVYREGSYAVVFKKTGNVFEPFQVSVGLEAADYILIESPVDEWIVAMNASYLVDSDSFIKAKPIEHESR